MTAFDWQKYILVAEKLQIDDSEESNRSGISRAYYATFNRAKILCLNEKLITTADERDFTGGIHSKVIKLLLGEDNHELNSIGHKLKTLRFRRNNADYKTYCDESGTSKLLMDTINKAKELLADMKAY